MILFCMLWWFLIAYDFFGISVVHCGEVANPSLFTRMTRRRFLEYSLAWGKTDLDFGRYWRPSEGGRLKCNFDVAIIVQFSIIFVSFRDSGSSLSALYTEHFPSFNPLLGEALPTQATMRIAVDHGWVAVDFETDCHALWQEWASDQQTGVLIRDVILSLRLLTSSLSSWSFSRVPRRLNRLPHLLAKWALRVALFGLIAPACIPFKCQVL